VEFLEFQIFHFVPDIIASELLNSGVFLLWEREVTVNKSERFGLVLTETEKRALDKLAEIEGGLSLAATLRRLISRSAEKRGLWPEESRTEKTAGRRTTAQ
jgi:hypothetical protein